MFILILGCCSGCTIDYDGYYNKYGNVYNKDTRLNSEKIEEGVLHFPSDNSSYINQYDKVYSGVSNDYKIYSTYYSSEYDTLYISYDIINNPIQTIDSRQLALIEEHLLNYFVSDSAKSDYTKYLKAVRIYPDYASSACRSSSESEEQYSKTEGCAEYDAYNAAINLNGLTTIDRFFNDMTYTEGNMSYKVEPKRDTFAHEFGHVSTYYNMILKGDDSYQDYLRLRLGDAYDNIYPNGMPNSYSSGVGYYTQPVEILADDYVELYYDVSQKAWNDYYDYTLEYDDLRNSLTDVSNVVKHLKDDSVLFEKVKEYYDVFINKVMEDYDNPIVVKASGNAYSTIHDIKNDNSELVLSNDKVIALGELTINNKIYYRIILSNVVEEINSRREYSSNIGYILKEECVEENLDVIKFNKYNGSVLDPAQYLQLDDVYLMPYYDFSYLILENDMVKMYNHLDNAFVELERSASLFN